MSNTAFVRLGPTSAALSKEIADSAQGQFDHALIIQCGQVPAEFGPGSAAWIWLGSDNNKGQPTAWKQGIRAIARCKRKDQIGPGRFELELSDIYIFSRTVEKQELLQTSPETYARLLSFAAIVGLNNYSSQVVQLLSDDESAALAAVMAILLPSDISQLQRRVPLLSTVTVLPRVDDAVSASWGEPADSEVMEQSQLAEDDPILARVRSLIYDDKVGGVLLVGPPGTGKTWYARQLALKLVAGRSNRAREVQFHPAYQYEDFVEGYVPDGNRGFVLADKHLLVMANLARDGDGPCVLVIDEFSRTDPSRVLGEAMTYMEREYRDVEFRLPSGRRASIPANLVFLATMNPEDRSVDDIDAAMERRWARVELRPDPKVLRAFLQSNAADGRFMGLVIEFFVALQRYISLGHAFFRSVRDVASLERLWSAQLHPLLVKKYRFDDASLEEVRGRWQSLLTQFQPVVGDLPAVEGDQAEAPLGARDQA